MKRYLILSVAIFASTVFWQQAQARVYPFPSGDVDAIWIDGDPGTDPPNVNNDHPVNDPANTDTGDQDENVDEDDTTSTSTESGTQEDTSGEENDETGGEEDNNSNSGGQSDTDSSSTNDSSSGTGSSDSNNAQSETDTSSSQTDSESNDTSGTTNSGGGADQIPAFTDIGGTTGSTGGGSAGGGGAISFSFDIDAIQSIQDEPHIEMIDVEDVETVEDLEQLVEATIQSDTKIKGVTIRPDLISLEYKQPAYILGIIPIQYTQRVTVSISGRELKDVEIKKPWWTFFTTGDNTDQLEQHIRNEVTLILQKNGELSDADVQTLLQKLAALFARIVELVRGFGQSVRGIFG